MLRHHRGRAQRVGEGSEMHSFQGEVIHANRRSGSDCKLWGALARREGGYWAVVPKEPGTRRRERIGGPFESAELASEIARREWRRRFSAIEHLNAYGEVCKCGRGGELWAQSRRRLPVRVADAKSTVSLNLASLASAELKP